MNNDVIAMFARLWGQKEAPAEPWDERDEAVARDWKDMTVNYHHLTPSAFEVVVVDNTDISPT